jgi:hypothetical protein
VLRANARYIHKKTAPFGCPFAAVTGIIAVAFGRSVRSFGQAVVSVSALAAAVSLYRYRKV